MHGTAADTGDGCAGSISGSTTLTGVSGTVLTFAWSARDTHHAARGARPVRFSPISRSDLVAFGASGSYVTRFVFVTIVCP